MEDKFLNGLVTAKYKMTAGDEVSYFDTIQIIEAPLSKYLEEILKTDEWGEICIHTADYHYFQIEYSHGFYKTDISIISNIMNKIVKKASYSGGWTLGNWRLEIE